MARPAKRIIADKYEVIGVLGEGGTGVVYDAVRRDDNTPVALKVMHDALAGDHQIRGRFQREAAILRRLEGEHISPILDFGEVPSEEARTSLLYIALPKVEGESLADLLRRGPLDVDRALDIMLEILAALASAHAQGVIHRDLKPANVLLKNGKTVVVVDFGMSKIITGAGLGTTNLTTHNMVFGTPEYMSPEQARGDELDARCDVYAAGVILYEMLTGAHPFTGATTLNILTAHLTSNLDPPSKHPSALGRVTPALDSVIVHALARDRESRYASARIFAAALARARVAPNDARSVHPAALSASPPSTDVFAATLPATIVGEAGVNATATTLVGNSRPTPLNPGQTPAHPAPSRRAPVLPSHPPPEPASTLRTWVILWVLVGFASIAIGVYFALRH